MKRLCLGIALVFVVAAPARAQVPTDALSELRSTDVYLEPGAPSVDVSSLEESVSRAAEQGITLKVAVLAGNGDAEQAAVTLRDGLGAVTVLVFTADNWGAASTQLSDSRLADVLDASAESLSSDAVPRAVASFVSALEPSAGFPWGLLLGVLLLFLGSIALFGRWWDAKARAERQAARVERRRQSLQDSVSTAADDVLELADKVQLADNEALAERYRDAAASFKEVESSVADAPDMHALDEAEQRLGELTGRLAAIRAAVDA